MNYCDEQYKPSFMTESKESIVFKRVAIALPDEVLDAMIITAGPLFEGDLLEEIKIEIQRTVETDTSILTLLYMGKSVNVPIFPSF